MFNCVTYTVLIVVCIFSAFSAPVYSQAQPDWTLEAFEKQHVTIVATTHFNDLVAGTDSGLYMHIGSQWLKLGNTFAPVRDIEMLDSFKMALAMGGKGQDSAGIYIGNFLWGMGIYSFVLIDTFSSPVSVAVKGTSGDTIFAGSKDRIVQTVRKTDGAYEKFTTLLKINYPSQLSALHYFTGDKMLYAAIIADYDSIFGHLSYYSKDSFVSYHPTAFSRLMESTDEKGFKWLHAASLSGHGFESDSGIYKIPPIMMSFPITKTPVPDKQIINDMAVIPFSSSKGELCIAVKNGVYRYSGSQWEKIGNIPSPPVCIAAAEYTTGPKKIKKLAAGTANGLYAIDISNVAIKTDPENYQPRIIVKYPAPGKIAISFTVGKKCQVSGFLFSIQGKKVAQLFRKSCEKGIHSINLESKSVLKYFSTGIYFLYISFDGVWCAVKIPMYG